MCGGKPNPSFDQLPFSRAKRKELWW